MNGGDVSRGQPFFAYCFTEECAEPLRGKHKIGQEVFLLYLPIVKQPFNWTFFSVLKSTTVTIPLFCSSLIHKTAKSTIVPHVGIIQDWDYSNWNSKVNIKDYSSGVTVLTKKSSWLSGLCWFFYTTHKPHLLWLLYTWEIGRETQ